MEIFRFALQRPAFAAPSGILDCIKVENAEEVQKELLTAAAQGNASTFNDPTKFAASFVFQCAPSLLETGYRSLHNAVSKDEWSLKALRDEISKDFGVSFDKVVLLPAFKADKGRLQNSVLLAKFVEAYPSWVPKEGLLAMVRAVHLIDVANSTDKRIGEALKDGNFLRKRLLRLPIIVPQVEPRKAKVLSFVDSSAKTNQKDIADLQSLYDKIALLPPSEFYAPISNPPDPAEPVYGSIKDSALTVEEIDLLKKYTIDYHRLTGEQVLVRIEAEIRALKSKTRNTSNGKTVLAGTSFISSEVAELREVSPGDIKGKFRPVGIADLLVVEQQLTGYAKADVAHIENVLEGETRSRVHSKKETTEVEITTETENTREEERDLQTTDRAEVKRELSQLLKEEDSLKAGASLSAAYGPTVEFKTYVDGSTLSTLEQAQKQATNFSKETVSRAVSKVIERILEKRRIRNVIELEEINKHEFSVSHGVGDKSVTGVYQWVEKIYEAQAWNYGKRVLYDVIVPEPSAYFLHALTEGADKRPIDLRKPDPFEVIPSELTRWNYEEFALRYKVSNVSPPPLPIRHVGKSFISEDKLAPGEHDTKGELVPIPEHYEAIGAYIVGLFTFYPGPASLDFEVGARTFRQINGSSWTNHLSLDNEVGIVNVGLLAFNVGKYMASFTIKCQLSPTGLSEWQTKAHAAILDGYNAQLRDYERKFEEYVSTILPSLFGRPPEENRKIEKIEIKKAVSSLFNNGPIDLGAIYDANDGPEIDLVKIDTQAKNIRFFEQAFEWEQMQYSFYPYFWGRRKTWLLKVLNQDADSLFREFLRAGAARVVLSVRPGFEDFVAHYFLTGEVWGGGDLPDITDPGYFPILQEIKQAQASPQAARYGESWQFRVPTSLVILRPSGDLPEWRKNEKGHWELTS
ncbi:hypothetical protein ABE599_08835 [Achromobacter mucicolens]|uniref:hypothetical protein n=1 Tax=Achromobacter mucicolens TaxID=1389922 RepID=UPI00320B68EF